ncbi:hypothetical protein KQX54_012453 [Cotesia glomerata]|uniref:Uncharacterized protein n=1 Tax=Cotesia glomerata TaxID=32391 RepID=A0AAV7I4H1_COTGL|nr:hypothetical protein KQX54_012453 [Cotesia glomerata]
MEINVHLLLHAVDSVRKSGPLWTNYTYPHEGNIHFLKMLVNGPKGVDFQIVKKSININSLKTEFDENIKITNRNVKTFCENLFSTTEESLTGTMCNGVLYNQADCVSSKSTLNKKYYNKCVYKKIIYTTMFYKKSIKWDDSYIQLKSGEFARIQEIFFSDNKNLLTVKLIDAEQININGINMTYLWKVKVQRTNAVPMSLENVLRKIIYIKGENVDFITLQPSNYNVN